MVRQRVRNSMSKHIFNTIISIVLLLLVLGMTYNEAKPIALLALWGMAVILKYNYKIYFDITAQDGFKINGTIVKADILTVFSAFAKSGESDFNYSLEIETDNGESIKCASKTTALVSGDRIENAYVTRRTNLLLYCDIVHEDEFK